MAETRVVESGSNGGEAEKSLKEKGNEFFKAGNYLKAAALYTQAIKLDPSNPTLYRHSSVLEAMEKYQDALAAFETALKHNPQSAEVSRKIKRLGQLQKEKQRAQELESLRSNVDMAKHLQNFKSELSANYGAEECWKEMFSFLVETMKAAVKSWHEAAKVDTRVYFLLDKEKTQTDKYAPAVNIDKAFESPNTHSNCFTYLRQYAEESFSKAACLVTSKSSISYPQVWKGQGSRKWKLGQNDGIFVQFESPFNRNVWFIPSTKEKGQTLCREPQALDIGAHEILPRIFKEVSKSSSFDAGYFAGGGGSLKSIVVALASGKGRLFQLRFRRLLVTENGDLQSSTLPFKNPESYGLRLLVLVLSRVFFFNLVVYAVTVDLLDEISSEDERSSPMVNGDVSCEAFFSALSGKDGVEFISFGILRCTDDGFPGVVRSGGDVSGGASSWEGQVEAAGTSLQAYSR
ncbi:hypothetical protein Bca101_008424 [Brassica carinata]